MGRFGRGRRGPGALGHGRRFGTGGFGTGGFGRLLGPRQLVAADVVVGLAAGVLGIPDSPAAWTPADVPLAVMVVAPIAVRRVWPVPAFAAALAAAVAVLSAPVGRMTGIFLVAMALYTVALTLPPRRSWLVLTLALAVTGITQAVLIARTPENPAFPGWPDPYYVVGTTWLMLGAVWAVGRAAAERGAYRVRSAEQRAERAVTEERLRIARELHDIVAHSMGLIAVKAAVAAHVAKERPEEAEDALRVIETTSRGSLTEMRRLLGILRAAPEMDPAGGPGSDEPGAEAGETPDLDRAPGAQHVPRLEPAPGLAGLPRLAENARTAGVRVDLDVRGDVPGSMGTSVYRIVQEGLTNVVKHAAPTGCRVAVAADRGRVRIEIVDDGGPGTREPRTRGGGHGLTGMRERVTMYGGTFTAGPRPGGGFRVAATWDVP